MGRDLPVNRDRFIRPSNLAAIADCPGRPTMEAAAVEADGEQPASEEASLGTQLHNWAQDAVVEWQNGVPWGQAIAAACNSATLNGIDSWSVWCLQCALEFVRDLIEKRGIKPENVMTEQQLDMAALGFSQNGTADLVLVIPRELLIILDYKFGFIDQGDAETNDQTQAYAGAGAETFQCERVEVFLVQPRAEKPYRFTGTFYDADTLRKNRAWTAAVIRRARAENPELNPGYSQCLYCKSLRRCAAVQEYLVNAQEGLAAIGNPVDPDSRGALIGAAKLAEKWAEGVKDWGKAQLLAGEQATGWKLGAGRAIRTIGQVPVALQRLKDAGHEQLALAALSMSYSKLPPFAVEAVKDLVVDARSSPSLIADKRSKGDA